MGLLKAYLVSGPIYVRYDIKTDRMESGLGYPKPVLGGGPQGGWALAGTGMEDGFDTALDDGYGKVWFFRGDQCVRVDNGTRATDHGLLPIGQAFPGLDAAGFGEGLTAAANWLDERAYFLRDDHCLAYDLVRHEVLWGPGPLADEFSGLFEAGFDTGVQAMTAWPNGKAYLFRGASYLRLDRTAGRVDGVPTPVAGNWPNVPPDVCAAVTSAWVKTELTAPVGRTSAVTVPNTADDQRFVARLLDRVPQALGGTQVAGPTLWSLPRDGACADDLIGAIARFQRAQGLAVDGRVDPPASGGVTIGRLVSLADSPLPGPIETRLADLAAQSTDLGPETGDLQGVPEGLGRRFAGGLLVTADAAEAVLIRGAAVDAWLQAGGLDGPLGRPLGDSADLADGTATASLFTGGTLVENPADGTVHTLPPAVGARLLDIPWDPGVPTGETGTVGPDLAGTYHAFTDAVAITDPDEAVHFTVHPIFDAWRLDPGTALTGLGWPVDDIRTDEDGIKGQAFTGGSLALQTDGTVTSVAAPAEPEPAPPLLRYLLAADPDRQLGAATPDNEVDFFLDGATAFVDMARTMRTATGPHDFIYLLGWYCDIDLELVPGQPWSALRSLLSAATHDDGDGRGAEVRCMLWQAKEKPPTPGAAVWEVARAVSLLKAFGGPPLNFTNYRAVQAINALPNGLAVLDNRTLLAGSHHQKLLIVRAGDRLVAYCGGMDLNPDRLHPQGVKGSRATGAPLQDVHLRIEGPGAFELLRTFRERWHATPEARGPLRGDALAPVSGMVAGPHLVQISHTYGRGCPFPTAIQTGREVLDNALRSARRYVYMECQYYVGNDHLRSALRDALRTIEVAIVVIAPLDAVDDLPDLAFRRKAFLAPLKTEFGDRLLVFEHLGDNRGTTTPGAYLHSKLILVDDEAAFIGTLNYSRRSWTHDSEVMVSIVDSRGPEGLGPLPGFAPALRQALWARRLGPLTPHDLTAALARFRSLPADARLVPYRHTTAVTRPKIAGVPVTPQVLDQYWHLLADPQG